MSFTSYCLDGSAVTNYLCVLVLVPLKRNKIKSNLIGLSGSYFIACHSGFEIFAVDQCAPLA